MKVAFYLTDNRNMRDGVTHYATEIINRLTADGGDYVGEAFLPYQEKKRNREQQIKESLPDLPLHTVKTLLPMRFLSRFCFWRTPLSYEALMHSRADVRVFFHNFLPRARMKAKKIVVIHDLTPLYSAALSSKKRKKLLARYSFTVKRADLIFTDSKFSESEILKNFPAAQGKIRVVYCGVDTSRFSSPCAAEKIDEVKAKYSLHERYILFMGQARENKNLTALLKAYALLPGEVRSQYALTLSNHDARLKELAAKLGILDRVTFLDGVSDEDVSALYQGASLVALCSLSEGFGLPLLEGMAAGVPTVTSSLSCLPEVAGGASVLVNPLDPSDMARGICNALTDSTLREELIARGYERVKLFSWEDAALKYKNAFDELQVR